MSSQSSIVALLKKTTHYDKDERYMAVSDLCDVLKREPNLDIAVEREICEVVLNLLHDQSNDVQAVAVKTLGVLLVTVHPNQVLEIADSLTDQVLDANKGELRDVYAIGLRTLVKTCPSSQGGPVANRLLDRLLEGIRNSNEEIVLACLDTLIDLLSRFGSISKNHEPVLNMCLMKLQSESPLIRKRAGNTLACLSTVLTDALLVKLMDQLLNTDGYNQQSLIRTLCTVSAAVGHRLGSSLDRIVPIFLQFTSPSEAVTGDDSVEMTDDTNTELRESCFMGFESLIVRCPREVEPHLDDILKSTLAFMSYDPNYSYGQDNDDDEVLADSDNEYSSDEYEEEEYFEDDDDDESWKVRRSAIRALKAVVEAKKHDPKLLWKKPFEFKNQTMTVSQALVGRFKEREENCRVGIIDCFTRLMRVTIEAAANGTIAIDDSMSDEDSIAISEYASSIVKNCKKILDVKKGNDRSKSSALALLATLCKAPGGIGNADDIANVFSHLDAFLSIDESHRDSSKTLRLDALKLIRHVLACDTHNPVHVRSNIAMILPKLCNAVQEKWYKIIAEAMRALSEIPKFYNTDFESGAESVSESERTETTDMLFVAIEPLLAAHDVDQEIKECALKACASLLSNMSLPEEKSSRLLNLLLDRLKNESTRIEAIKTISNVSKSGCNIKLILPDSITTMASFLRLQSRSLKQNTLEALIVITEKSEGSAVLYSSVLPDLAPLIADRDLHLSHLSLAATVSILKACPSAGSAVKTHILEPALNLSTSSLLVDSALESLLSLFEQMVVTNAVVFTELFDLLRQRLSEHVAKRGVYNLSKCLAVITASTGEESLMNVLGDVFKVLDGSNTPTDDAELRQVQLSILLTGDLGRMLDLTTLDDVADRLKPIYVGYFDSYSDELKSAAAYAMGNASVGSPSSFLQVVVTKLDEENRKQQYLLLSALREFIQCSSREGTSVKIDSNIMSMILPPLERHCSDEEEGVRSMIAECLGSLACIKPDLILKKLAELQESHSAISSTDGVVADDDDDLSKKNALVCVTVASSVKIAISGKIDPSELTSFMSTFVKMLQQDELHVRNAAFLMVYSAVHHMPQVVSSLVKDDIMPALFEVSALQLKRKVDLGPFTHTVDDALPLRKSALGIFATLLDNVPGSLEISDFMPVLAKALGDAEDIQLHAHSIVISMCTRHPAYIVAAVDSFVEPLEKTMHKKPGQKTGTELERLNDWIKSAIRVMLTLSKVEGTMSSQKFSDFVERVKGDSKFSATLASLEEEK